MSGRGFSLVETVVAVGVLTVTAGLAAAGWQRFRDAVGLESGLRQVAADLQAARTLALASAGAVRLVFQAGAAGYVRERADDAGVFRVDATRTLPAGVRIAAINSEGDLAFSSRGTAENGTLTLRGRHGVRRAVVLNQRGRVTVQAAGS
jgi:Tfp pilus assembly protein FimT